MDYKREENTASKVRAIFAVMIFVVMVGILGQTGYLMPESIQLYTANLPGYGYGVKYS
jgi:hypothetical protein